MVSILHLARVAVVMAAMNVFYYRGRRRRSSGRRSRCGLLASGKRQTHGCQRE
jgi:hypothetical protein